MEMKSQEQLGYSKNKQTISKGEFPFAHLVIYYKVAVVKTENRQTSEAE